jgi:hypothetical protein
LTVLRSALFSPLRSALRSPLALRKGGFDWYPGVLYQPGDILLWYDPSDLTTMYQDVAGTSPVTADGQSVLLMLDKGQWGGKTLTQVLAAQAELRGTGAPVLVGTATAATYNTGTGAGAASRVDAANQSGVAFSLNAGVTVAIDIETTNAEGVLLRTGTSPAASIAGPAIAGSIRRTVLVTGSGGGNLLVCAGNNGVTTTFTVHSIKEIPGYHRVQATGTQAPKYKTGPNPAAAEASPELRGGGTLVLDGTATAATYNTGTGVGTATRVDAANQSGVAIPLASGVIAAIDIEATTANGVLLRVGTSPAASTAVTPSLAGSTRATIIATGAAGGNLLVCSGANGVTVGFTIHSIKEIPASAPYIHWLLYDGTDDGNATPTINWGTDEVAICAGVTKSSDAAAGAFAELSATSASNNGTFAMLAPASAAANYYWRSKGTVDANMTVTTYTAPTTNVLTGQGKIATDLATLRADGAQVGTSATDQGTGNFGNHILYFGRRGGSSLPFNGKEHQTVIRSRLLSASELAKLETFTAAKTGVIL